MPGTWLFSRITRWKTTSFSRRRRSSRWCSKRACSCLKGGRLWSRTSKFASRSSCRTRHRACSSSFPIRLTSARSRSRAGSSKASAGRCTSSDRCAASAPNRPSRRRSGSRYADAQPVEVEGFYRHMSDLGLRYGEEFRPIRELAAGAGRSAGRVALSEVIARRASEYALHPVLFDGALQVFSAGAATVEDRQARMKLPVRFARILFLRSPGASSRVRARVQRVQRRFRRRRHQALRRRRESRACWWMASARSACRAPAAPVPGRRARRDISRRLGANTCGCRKPAIAPASAGAIARGDAGRAGSRHGRARPFRT